MLTNEAARKLAGELIEAADTAEKAGKPGIDVIGELQVADNAARAEEVSAIENDPRS